ncbi:peptide transporter [Bacillus sp. FJAT-27986]|nr:peptide transporter [Bacillus sp. FJAT-27986]
MLKEREFLVKLNKQSGVPGIPNTGFFGHPKGLFTLFFTEFWERFSYYGMRAILVLYLYAEVSKGGLGFDQTTAMSIAAIYGSLVYLSGIIGGWVADRLLGTSRTVFYGGVFIMLGHVVLALPLGAEAFFASMFLIIIGTGLLKPNISSVVGDLYTKADNRRDSGFSIFYMGINLGAFIAPFVVEGLRGHYDSYHAGFSAAAVGMFLGLIVFVITKKKNLGTIGTQPPNPLSPEGKKKFALYFGVTIALLIVLFYALITIGWLTIDRFVLLVTILAVIIPVVYFVWMYKSSKTTAEEQSRLLAYIPLFLSAVIFWAIYEQGSNLLNIYALERTNLTLLGFKIAPGVLQAMPALFVIIFAPVAAWLWMKLGDRQPSTSRKFSIGLLLAGLSFIVMLVPGYLSGGDSLVSPYWLILSYLIVTLGELCLSPVGLSATTKLAPAAFSAQTMSLWFLASAVAQAINAQLVKLYSTETELLYFGLIGGFAILCSIIIYFISPTIQKYMRGVK